MKHLRILTGLSHWSRAIILICAVLAGVLPILTGTGTDLDNALRSQRYSLFPKAPSGQLVIVRIDNRSTRALGPWPWPRGQHAALIDQLGKAGADRLVFDIIFLRPASDPRQDRILADALRRTPSRFHLPALSENLLTGKDKSEDLPTKGLLDTCSPGKCSVVSIWTLDDDDNVSRRAQLNVPFRGEPQISMAQVLAGTRYPGVRDFPIDWSYAPTGFPSVSYIDVLNGDYPPGFFRGKTVLIGVDSYVIGDRVLAPHYGSVPGMMVQAVGSETLRQGLPVDLGPWPALFAILLTSALALRLRLAWRFVTVPFCIGGLIAIQFALEYYTPLRLEIAPALIALLSGLLAQSFISMAQAILDRMTRSAEAGLPNLTAMTIDEHAPGTTVVVSLRNYQETTALLGSKAQADLLRKVSDRLALTSDGRRIYQIDNHSFAWRITQDTSSLVDSLEGLQAIFSAGITIDNLTVDIPLNAGFCDDRDLSVEDAVARANVALSHAVQHGLFWERYETQDEAIFWKLSLLTEFEQAIGNGNVWVAYQPKLDLRTGRITGAEALARWNHPERGYIRPDKFIPVLEDAGRIEKLTLFVLEKAIADFAPLGLSVAVNLSTRMLGKNRVAEPVRQMLARYGMEPRQLTLEITESGVLTDNAGLEELHTLVAMGIHISIDDYGTGQSTLSYLKRLPATELKIDQSFVRQMLANRSDAVLIDSTIKLGHQLGMEIVAEGVEDGEIIEQLKRLECDSAQGYHIGKPVPIASFVNSYCASSAKVA